MSLPPTLAVAVAGAVGSAIVETKAVGGGDISQAARLRLADGRELLLKWRSGPPAGIFTAEQRGLALLRQANALRVPQVFACAGQAGTAPGFIAMEWLGRGSSTSEVVAALGAGLAAQHRVTASTYGLDHDNFIGANPQPNRPAADWVSFFREQRLGYQLELAGRNGYLPRSRASRLETLLAHLGDWLPAHPPASLLHGDLWGGNWLVTAAGQPALIDPAVYYGHREADLAFTELFGGFPAGFYAAYRQAWPLDPGYEERKDLYNLYHLLNHLNLFGEGYGNSVDATLRRYTG